MNTGGSLGGMPQQGYPVRIPGLTDVKSVSAAGSSAYAIRNDGTVWFWGGGSSGPSQVPGLSGITAVKGLYGGALALKSDGTVWAWAQRLR